MALIATPQCPSQCNSWTCERRSCWRCCFCGRGNCTLARPEPPRAPSSQEHELLELLLESLTASHAQHAPGPPSRGVPRGEFWLRNRAWEGGGHIGNRPAQALAYYDLARAEAQSRRPAPLQLCEVGLNGGHSALILLAAGGQGARLHMFDFLRYSYSRRAVATVDALFPGGMTVHVGSSRATLPGWARGEGRASCDLFSVDGDHRYHGALADLSDATHATRPGGLVVLDDMAAGSQTRRAFDAVLAAGALTNATCREGERILVSTRHRLDTTAGVLLNVSWCSARVTQPFK